MSKRAWIKIHCDRWLNGSINKAPIEERGVWVTLLCIAGNSDFGGIGFLSITENQGMIDHQIATLMHVSVKTWRKYKERFTSSGRITIHGNNVIEINNWKHYQSEYSRQKSYKPPVSRVTSGVTPKKEKESKNKKEKESIDIPPDNQQQKKAASIKIKLLEKAIGQEIVPVLNGLSAKSATYPELNHCLAQLIKYKPDRPRAYSLKILDEFRQQQNALQSAAESDKHKSEPGINNFSDLLKIPESPTTDLEPF